MRESKKDNNNANYVEVGGNENSKKTYFYGDDTRVKLPDDKPNPSIVRIVNMETQDLQKQIWGTGIIIRQDKILTAAHVIKEIREKPGSWVVIVGDHGRFGLERKILQTDYNKKFSIAGARGKYSYDIGIITVKEDLPAEYVKGVQDFYSYPSATKECYSWIGYPRDNIRTENKVYQWFDKGVPIKVSPLPQQLIFGNFAYEGQSGSGLINPAENVVGVLSFIRYVEEELMFTIIDKVNFEYIRNEFNDYRIIDFQHDVEEARNWGGINREVWEKAIGKESIINRLLSLSHYKELIFSPKEYFQSDKAYFKDLEQLVLPKAAVLGSVMTYKNVSASEIGFNKTLTTGNIIKDVDLKKFSEQFLNRSIKFDNHLEAYLTEPELDTKQRIILKITVPVTRESDVPLQAGVILSDKEYKMVISNSHVLYINKISAITVKGIQYLRVEATAKENGKDFKNYQDTAAIQWINTTYENWFKDITKAQQEALEDYVKQDHIEINKYLREQGGAGNAKLDEKIKNISESMDEKIIPQNITLYRWSDISDFSYSPGTDLPPLLDFEEKILNTIRKDKGYMNTFLSSEQFSGFDSKKIILRLQVPKGSRGVPLYNVPGASNNERMTILLDKGSEYQVDKVTEVMIERKKHYVVDGTVKLNTGLTIY
ncbi:ADP-ribosyltransferase [Bacillus thuringiensis]|uniref:ADP-ribosyltransferase n=1 Tax=Bacillus thuringiensis TaxID=1428 RepID=UPI000BF69B9E|nr:ADP-ribosyltransferase [Bacillus thuringiensis]PFN63946.1 hypothetical protein COJ75_00285 [Bacillus thuringiensis]